MAKSSKTVLIVVLVAIILISGASLIKLRDDISKLKAAAQQLELNFRALRESHELMKKENHDLQEENRRVKEDAALTKKVVEGEIGKTQLEIEKTLDRLNEFEIKVDDSIDWFRQNTNVANISAYETIRQELGKCVKVRGNCTIDLGCINNVNQQNYFEYSSDDRSTGRKDYLKNLSMIYGQKGGDCEDFSLLFRAEYDYLVDTCLQNVTREKIVPFTGDEKIPGTYMYIVCGSFDPGGVVENWGGHCLVALTAEPILSSLDIYKKIRKSTLVEPQNGEFVADMSNTNVTKIFDNGMPPDTLHHLSMVITNDDLIIFNAFGEMVEWEGYHDFLDDIGQLKGGVEK